MDWAVLCSHTHNLCKHEIPSFFKETHQLIRETERGPWKCQSSPDVPLPVEDHPLPASPTRFTRLPAGRLRPRWSLHSVSSVWLGQDFAGNLRQPFTSCPPLVLGRVPPEFSVFLTGRHFTSVVRGSRLGLWRTWHLSEVTYRHWAACMHVWFSHFKKKHEAVG